MNEPPAAPSASSATSHRPVPPEFDPAAFAARFGSALHQAGVPATPERSARFLQALHLLPPVDRQTLYWAARLAFVSARAQLETFDRVFEIIFGDLDAPTDTRRSPNNPPLPGLEPGPAAPPDASPTPPRTSATPLPDSGTHPDPTEESSPESTSTAAAGASLRLLGSSHESFAQQDFATFGPGELAELDRLLADLTLHIPLRRSRRRNADPTGRHVDLRRSLRRSMRTGGETVRLARTQGRLRRRTLVLLCDISGSMEPYARVYLRFLSRLCTRPGQSPTEIFVFATRLTRLTPVLRHTSPDAALQRAGSTAPDWSSGTLIGRSLADFTNRFGRRGMARGAIVVIFSDGWEGQDPAAVGRETACLGRLAHRLIWVNPRKAAPGYAPLAGGMAAALPHCDAFVSGHNLAALAELFNVIGAESPPGRRTPAAKQGAGWRHRQAPTRT